MRDIPIEVLLSFPTPNYVNPETHGSALLIINTVFAGLVLTAVGLRMYTRIFIKRWVGSDDIYIVIAMIFTIALNVVVILANERYFWNRHVYDIQIKDLADVGKIAMAAKALFTMASFSTRCSLLRFYYRLISDTGLTRYRWALHAATVFNIAVCITFIPLTVFQCTPISAYWTFPASGKCIDEGTVTLAAGGINCFADILITTLPIPMILKLQMPLRQRMGVVVLLSLGFIVTVAGAIRTYFIWKALVQSYDETWFSYPLWICAAVEIDLAVLCACAPSLRPLLIALVKPIIDSLYSSGTDSRSDKSFGMLSSGATSGLNSQVRSPNTMDYELEKGSKQQVDVDVAFEIPKRPRRKLSKTRKPDIPSEPIRLSIVEKHSFEVRHEDRRSQDANEEGVRRVPNLIINKPHSQPMVDRPRTSNEGGRGSSPHLRIPSQIPHLRTPTPISPLSESFIAKGFKLDDEPLPSVQDSFYISELDEDESARSTKTSDWPLGPMDESLTTSERKEVERRWHIDRNPFMDSDYFKAESAQRAATAAGVPSHSRWRSEPHLWTEIHNTPKRPRSSPRSGSLTEQGRGVAMML